MEENEEKNDEMLRDTVKSNFEEKNNSCKKLATILVVAFLLIAITIAIVLLIMLKEDKEVDIVISLINRRFPDILDRFKLTIDKSSKETFYEISSSGEDALKTKISIKANNILSLAAGLGYYLRYHALSQLSWTGDSLTNLNNKRLPPLKNTIRKTSTLQYSYYMNVCTESYSSSWWDWSRWEREIDWMALNGINLPLAFTGVEYVTKQLFEEYGFNETELEEFFTGPAFLAWNRMGNVNGWASPLPNEWIEYQKNLQLKILERMREFEMTPVLSMFAGYVPPTFKQHFPEANVTLGSDWANFDLKYRTYNLEVTDPLYKNLSKKYIEIQTKIYGTNHIYNGDVYNEMLPPSNDTEYLKNSSKGTFEGIKSADPDAIWLMQGWLFVNEAYFWGREQVKAYLDGVPNDGMIILDLYTEYKPVFSQFDNYFGKKWIWCMLHNFGGNPGMWGNLTHILQKPQIDKNVSNGTMVGIGITMEAIEQNYIVYEAMLENKWLDDKVENISLWVENYVNRRYGNENLNKLKEAWEILKENVYNSHLHNLSKIERVPDFFYSNNEKIIDYDVKLSGSIENLWKAWELFLDDENDNLKNLDTYKHDIVDLGVNILTNEFDIERNNFTIAYQDKNLNVLKNSGEKLLEIIKDADELLSSDKIYLLGRWINNATNIAPNENLKDLFEFNARNLVTLWGPDGNINDYARKSWGGLYIDYYYQRWEMFIDQVVKAVESGTDFNYDQFKEDDLNFGRNWQHQKNKYSSEPVGDTCLIAKKLFGKYKRI